MRSRDRGAVGPLTVLFVVPDLALGGAERHVATLLPRLDPARFRPSVLCIGEEGALFGAVAGAGVPATALHRRRAAAPVALLEMVRHLRALRPDVVTVRGYNAEMLGRLAALLCGVPVVLTWVHNHQVIRRRSALRRVADRLLNPRTTAVVGIVETQRRHLVDDLGYRDDQVRIVVNGVDPDVFAPVADRAAAAAALGLDPDEPVVVLPANLRPAKDHPTVLRAFATLLRSQPAARLLVVGDGPLNRRVRELAAALEIDGAVRFLGARDDMDAVLAAAHVCVLGSWTECFPMVLLEAMAMALPVVATAVGGVPAIVDDGVTGHLVPPGDPDALAARLAGLLAAPDTARAMGRAGRERVEQYFALDAAVRCTEAMIEREAGRVPLPPAYRDGAVNGPQGGGTDR